MKIEVQLCEECKNEISQVEDWHQGDTICKFCGRVAPERLIDTEHEEKRTFNADRSSSGRKEDNSRTARMHENSDAMNTTVAFDSNPNNPNAELSKNLSSLQNSLITYKDQKLNDGIQNINNICDVMRLNDRIKGRAVDIWKDFEKQRKKYSRAGDKNMYLAIVYTACKEENLGRTFKEIADSSGGDIKQITRSYKRLVKLRQESTGAVESEVATVAQPVEDVKPSKAKDKQRNKGTTAVDMMPRITQKLNLHYSILAKAREIAERAAPFLEGKHPNTIAAASLLYYLKQNKDASAIFDKEVAKAAGVAPSTMRSAYRVLEENKLALVVE